MRIKHKQNKTPTKLDTVAELGAIPSANMISATMHIFHMQNINPSKLDTVAEMEVFAADPASHRADDIGDDVGDEDVD